MPPPHLLVALLRPLTAQRVGPLELLEVQRAGGQDQPVAGRLGDEAAVETGRGQGLAKARDVDLHRIDDRGGWVLTPHLVDDRRHGADATPREGEQRQQRPCPRRTERERGLAPAQVERTEDEDPGLVTGHDRR